MAWEVEKGVEGRPIWRGEDAIFDVQQFPRKDRFQFGCMGVGAGVGLGSFVFVGLPLLVLSEKIWGAGSPVIDHVEKVIYTAVFIFTAAVVIWWTGKNRPKKFITRDWHLATDGQALAYEAGPFAPSLDPIEISPHGDRWAVPFDAVASVEAGPTSVWQSVRHYEGGGVFERADAVQAIPDVEWQTFLILTDQTRRVIYTANADREGCGALAASIRAHVEAARGASAPALSTPAAPAGDGFDL